jgi:hypothetical protein
MSSCRLKWPECAEPRLDANRPANLEQRYGRFDPKVPEGRHSVPRSCSPGYLICRARSAFQMLRARVLRSRTTPATVAEAVAPIAQLIGTWSTRNIVILGPMMRGVGGYIDAFVLYSHEDGAAACEVSLGSWRNRRTCATPSPATSMPTSSGS